MSKSGKRLLLAAKEAVAIAEGREQPGSVYNPNEKLKNKNTSK